MPEFAYRAVDQFGKRTRGRLSGISAAAVTRELELQGLLPLDVREAGGRGLTRAAGGSRATLEFTRAVAALLPAGMPLARALRTATEASPASARPALSEVCDRVERGDELAAALAAHPALFSPLYIGVVRAGEKGGALDAAFQRLAKHLEHDAELRSKLISMSIYPALLAVVGLAAVLLLVLFVLPRFADLLAGSGAALPRSTAAVLAVSSTVREHWRLLAAGGVLLALLVMWMRTTAAGRAAAARALLAVPVIGTYRRQALGASFARMVGELLAGGAPLLNALADTRDCLADPIARAETEQLRQRVREGASLNRTLAQSSLFPPILAQLVALGEEAGRLSEFLLKAADMLERATERAVERLVSMIEPAMIVVFGGMVALVALALLQAIYGVNAGGLR